METEQTAPPIPRPLLATAALLLLVFALASVHAGYPVSGILAAALAVPALVQLIPTGTSKQRGGLWWLRGATVVLFGGTIAVFFGHLPPLITWTFLVPLLLFAVWPLSLAIAATLVFLALVVWLAQSPVYLGPVRHQLTPMLLLSAAVTGLFVYLREYKAAQLAPLRRTDSLTLASTHDYLQSDLYKEIQRSEREGTPMTVAALQLDEPDHPLASDDRTALIVRLGRLLHQQLRDFDSYYRVNETAFFLILPVTDTAQALRKADQLREQASKALSSPEMTLTLSIAVAGMNVGDDTATLESKAREALRLARKQGGNRTLSHTDGGAFHD